MSWQPVNLASSEFATRSEPPCWCDLIYAGKRHLISGPPEAAKTLLAWIIGLNAIRSGTTVAALDFEMGPEMTRLLLEDLGATLDEIRSIYYVEPDSPPTEDDYNELIASGAKLAIIDAAAGAYDASELDDGKRKDAEAWSKRWIKPLNVAGVSTLLIDHVVKNADARGKFSIGSERKAGTVDVHLGLEDVKTLTRGGSGLIKIRRHKDRPAHLPYPYAAELELHSDPDTHAITWTLREPVTSTDSASSWQPTVLMERVSKFVEQQGEPVSLRVVEDNVKGKSRTWIRKAVEELLVGGYITETPGLRKARMLSHVTSYTTSPDLAPARPANSGLDLAQLAPPLRAGEVRGEVNGEVDVAQQEMRT